MFSATNSVAEGVLVTKPKDRRQSSSGSTVGTIRRQPSSFANDASRKASFQRSDAVDGDYILSFLEDNPEIQELRCEDFFGAEHLEPLHRLLVNYHSSIHLHSLELPKNELSSDAGEDLSNLVRSQQQTLSKLDLSRNPLTLAGLSPLLDPLISESSPSRLIHLNLSDTQLGSKGATTIASILRYSKSLQELYLGHNNMGTKGMKTIAAELGTNSTLRVLDVSYNNIKKSGASILAESLKNSTESNLRVIDISCNNLGPAGLQAFAKLLAVDRKIEGFYAGRNLVGAEGASILRNALKVNYTLKELRLDNNDIGDLGAWMLADSLAENEHRSSAIEKIVLGWNDIGLEGAVSLANALKENNKLRHIDLTGNNICSSGAEALADSLSYNLSLEELILTGNRIDDTGAFALAMAMGKPTCSLEALAWQENPISSEGEASIERAPQLRRNQKYWFGQTLRDLSKGAISSIHLAERNIGDEELLLLTDVLESTSPLIRCLWLSGRGLSPRSLIPFCERALGSGAKIVRLYMKNCNCADDMARALSSVLKENTTMEVLSLTDSSLSTIGASAVADGLSENSTLRRLNLDRNDIGDVGMAALGQVIPKTSLQSLSVSRNSLTDQSMNFEYAKDLQELHMDGNKITDRGALELCRFLVDDCRLGWLSLRQNHLTQRGGTTIKTFLSDAAIVEY